MFNVFKRIAFTLFNWDITIKFNALRAWNDCKVFKRDEYVHIVWGCVSILIENWALELHALCAQCDSPDIGERFAGDEGITVCESCGTWEGGYRYVNLREYDSKLT